jgi:hypothetical protein
VGLPTAMLLQFSPTLVNAAILDSSDPIEVLGKALQLPHDISGYRDKAIADASVKIQYPADIF